MSVLDTDSDDSAEVLEIAGLIRETLSARNHFRETPDQAIKALIFVTASTFGARFGPPSDPDDHFRKCLDLCQAIAESMELFVENECIRHLDEKAAKEPT